MLDKGNTIEIRIGSVAQHLDLIEFDIDISIAREDSLQVGEILLLALLGVLYLRPCGADL